MKEEDSKRKKDPKQSAGTKVLRHLISFLLHFLIFFSDSQRKARDEPEFPKGCLVLLKNIGGILWILSFFFHSELILIVFEILENRY
jgi:hypothetical protein